MPKTTEQFASFRRLYRHLPDSFYENAAFALTAAMIGLLLLEQIAQFFFRTYLLRTGQVLLGSLAEFFVLFSLGKRLLLPGRKLLYTLCDLALGAMLLWSIVSTVLSPDPAYCFLGSSYRLEGLSTYLIYASFFLCCRMIRRQELIWRLLWFFGICVTVLGMIALLQSFPFFISLLQALDFSAYHLTPDTLNSILDHENHFAYLVNMAVVFFAGIFLFSTSAGQKRWSLALFILNFLVLLRNNTLGCYIAALIGICFLCIMLFYREGLRWKEPLILLGSFLLLSILCELADFSVVNSTNRGDSTMLNTGIFEELDTALDEIWSLSPETTKYTNNTIRLKMWQIAWEYIRQRPVLGLGPDGSGITERAFSLVDRPHNEYIQYALYLGIPGAAMYLTALGSLFLRCLRQLKALPVPAVVLGGVVFAYCASAFIGNTMYYTTIYFFCFLGLLTGLAAQTE